MVVSPVVQVCISLVGASGEHALQGRALGRLPLELSQERNQIGLLFLRQLQFQEQIKELHRCPLGSDNGRREDTAGSL